MHSNHTDEGAPSVSCAVLHTDDEGNTIPCPGHGDGQVQADPLAEARALIARDLQQRMEACAAEIEAVLAKHGMRLDVTPAQISIVPAN